MIQQRRVRCEVWLWITSISIALCQWPTVVSSASVHQYQNKLILADHFRAIAIASSHTPIVERWGMEGSGGKSSVRHSNPLSRHSSTLIIKIHDSDGVHTAPRPVRRMLRKPN